MFAMVLVPLVRKLGLRYNTTTRDRSTRNMYMKQSKLRPVLLLLAFVGSFITAALISIEPVSAAADCKTSDIQVSQARAPGGNVCYWSDQSTLACLEPETQIRVQLTGVVDHLTGETWSGIVKIGIEKNLGVGSKLTEFNAQITNGNSQVWLPNFEQEPGNYQVTVESVYGGDNYCEIFFTINETSCSENSCIDEETYQTVNESTHSDPFVLCNQLPAGSEAQIECIECANGGSGGSENPGDAGRQGIWTAVGCINRDPTQIAQQLITVGLSIGGGVALLMILGAGFIFSTSQGDPKRTGDAKELMTAAITGLLFILFSVTILQFIGYSVLRIPGFGG